jgi:hypothetical protein
MMVCHQLIRIGRYCIACLAVLVGSFSYLAAQTINFADTRVNESPAGFEFLQTGQGQAGRWKVVDDNTVPGGKALEQTSADSTDYRFPLAIYEAVSAANIEVKIRFKAVSGSIDRAGGIVVRLTDANNYYVVRANALEGNVRFYRVVKGQRQQLASVNTRVTVGEWHTLALRAEGNRFKVSFDEKPLISTSDGTFRNPGKTGFWTKADSITRFEKLEINVL